MALATSHTLIGTRIPIIKRLNYFQDSEIWNDIEVVMDPFTYTYTTRSLVREMNGCRQVTQWQDMAKE